MRTDLHTKTAIRRNAAGAVPLLIAVIALILSGCNLSSPAGFIKDQMARGTGTELPPPPAGVTYTVTFDTQGRGAAPSAQTVSPGGLVTEPPVPAETGWAFGGWFKEAGCTAPWNFAGDTVTGGITLYAKWANADDAEDFSPGDPVYVMNIASGGTTLHGYLNGIKGIPGNHVVNLSGSQTHNFSGPIALASGVNISLRGTTADIVCISSYTGALFTINTGAKFILRGPTLQGRSSNNASVVNVNGGAFFLRGGDITGNTASYSGGGVYIDGGTFSMSGGTISSNTAYYSGGGGVYVDNGTFVKTGGIITGTGGPNPNNATGNGKAVYVSSGPKYRDITAGPGDTVDTATDTHGQSSGFWLP